MNGMRTTSTQLPEAAPRPAGAPLAVTLKNGSYVLYCPVANHRALGMQTDLTVG